MTKQRKGIIRERLRALIAKAAAKAANENNETSDVDDNNDSSDDEEEESEQEDADDEASVASDPESSEDESGAKTSKARRMKKKLSSNKTNKKPKRLSKRKAARATKVMDAQKLRRKKRMEELKVRNEEMLLNQSKEDEERQEAIAAKFETNSDELRLKRLEDRLDLLQRLDETRISVVETKEETPVKKDEEKSTTMAAENDAVKQEELSESEEFSSDEEDLVIVGMKKPIKPLKRLLNHGQSSSLAFLNEIRSPKNKKKANRPKPAIQKSNKDGMIMSPGRSMGARFALRNALKQKQRKVGNRWLARELGYKTEEDHLKDCKTAAEQKRGMVVKLEQERLKANERKQLRERIMLQEQNYVAENDPDDDPDDEAYVENDDESPPAEDAEEEEEDEEMKMAKEIEQEEAKEKGPDNIEVESQSGVTNDDIETTTAEDTQAISPALDLEVDSNKNSTVVDNEEAEAEAETQPLETQQPYISKTIETETKEGQEISSSSSDTFGKVSVSKSSESKKDSESFVKESLLETQPVLGGANKECVFPSKEDSELDGDGQSPFDSTVGNDLEVITETVTAPDESVVTPEKKDDASDDEEELEFDDNVNKNDEESPKDPNRSRNAGWQAMLKREAEKLKKQKKRKGGGGLVDEEAEEEEEEEVAGLEDFGFSISKKKKGNDDEEGPTDQLDEDDLKHVVDDVSDDEGDEDAGRLARIRLEQREEKDSHKEMLRRMREGYDGRRGGIAGGGTGARGMHRFDQLVAADNRNDAKRLGLLNDDELDSDDEKEGEKSKADDVDEEEDETALLDKMLKDRFLHRSDADLEENFSDDEEEEENEVAKGMLYSLFIIILS
jgi:hypothetical protein